METGIERNSSSENTDVSTGNVARAESEAAQVVPSNALLPTQNVAKILPQTTQISEDISNDHNEWSWRKRGGAKRDKKGIRQYFTCNENCKAILLKNTHDGFSIFSTKNSQLLKIFLKKRCEIQKNS